MKDFESVYSKLSINYNDRASNIKIESKRINKIALMKASICFIICAIIIYCIFNVTKTNFTAPDYLFRNIGIIIAVPFIISLVYCMIVIAIEQKKSSIIDFNIIYEIHNSLLKEIPGEAVFYRDKPMTKELYELCKFEKHDGFISISSYEGMFNSKNNFIS